MVLNSDEKKYLRATVRYLQSLGMHDGIIEVEMDDWYSFEFDDIDWNLITNFSNNYRAEVPTKVKEILEKVSKHISDSNSYDFNEPDGSYDYGRIEFDIDGEKQELTVSHMYSYTSAGDSVGSNWSVEEDGQYIKEIFDVLKTIPDIQRQDLEVRYNGGGDSGYIEDYFDGTIIEIPSILTDFCYNQLESQFGGWEINEGSNGTFEIDMENETIQLYHTQNYQENEYDTIFEESFA